mgnify:CR=1 FL=1
MPATGPLMKLTVFDRYGYCVSVGRGIWNLISNRPSVVRLIKSSRCIIVIIYMNALYNLIPCLFHLHLHILARNRLTYSVYTLTVYSRMVSSEIWRFDEDTFVDHIVWPEDHVLMLHNRDFSRRPIVSDSSSIRNPRTRIRAASRKNLTGRHWQYFQAPVYTIFDLVFFCLFFSREYGITRGSSNCHLCCCRSYLRTTDVAVIIVRWYTFVCNVVRQFWFAFPVDKLFVNSRFSKWLTYMVHMTWRCVVYTTNIITTKVKVSEGFMYVTLR